MAFKTHEKGVSGTAAKGGFHVEKLGITQNEKSDNEHGYACGKAFGGGNKIGIVKEVHGFSHHDGVNEHGEADGFLHGNVDQKDDDGNTDGSGSVKNAQRLGKTQIQHVPGCGSDVGFHGEVDTETVYKKGKDGHKAV